MDKRDFSGAWDRCRAVLRLLRNCRPSSMRGIPQYKLLVGTFHKSGTVLMQSIWAQACRSMGIAIWTMNRHSKPPNPNWQVAFHYDSEFGDLPLQHLHRGLIVIRDPRDLLISGMHYHRKSQELWLHQKKREFGGVSYQEKINSFKSDEDRMLFEMDNTGGRTIARMIEALKQYPDFYQARLETLMTDRDLVEYEQIFCFLGFSGSALKDLLYTAKKNSAFNLQNIGGGHIRSGRPELWRTEFTPRVMDAFIARYGNLPVLLGYSAP